MNEYFHLIFLTFYLIISLKNDIRCRTELILDTL